MDIMRECERMREYLVRVRHILLVPLCLSFHVRKSIAHAQCLFFYGPGERSR